VSERLSVDKPRKISGERFLCAAVLRLIQKIRTPAPIQKTAPVL